MIVNNVNIRGQPIELDALMNFVKKKQYQKMMQGVVINVKVLNVQEKNLIYGIVQIHQ